MNSKPTKSEDQAELELPVLDQVVDPDSERGKLITALDELTSLLDRVPKGSGVITQEEYAALRDDLNAKLVEMFDEMAERMKYIIPKMVEQTLREHLDKKIRK